MKNKFNFFDLESNDKLSLMSEKDKCEFIKELLKYKLKLRNNLGIDNSLTFGLELEFENIKCDINKFSKLFSYLELPEGNIVDLYHDTHLWNLVDDKTLDNGEEIRSPILIDNQKYWLSLSRVCSFVKKYASVGEHSAGHIHIGSQILNNKKEALLNLIKLWGVYENIFYRYGFNDFLNQNPGIKFSKPSSTDYLKIYDKMFNTDYSIESLLLELPGRVKAINFSIATLVSDYKKIAYKDTIEFRSPNGTLDSVIWQNNVNTFIKLILTCLNDKFDMDIVLKRQRELENSNDRFDYNKIYLDSALELSDIIFDNNLDKLYFLRQYIKNNEVSNEPMKRTKKFTS